MSYAEFLAAKGTFDHACGFEIADSEIHPILLPHQRAVVAWAVAGGRRALFESFGLGKSVQQIEICRLTLHHAGGDRALIVCPLGVRGEFARDAAMLGQTVRFVRRSHEVDGPGIYITNYESVRDGRLDPNLFTVVSLDEASVLRSFGSKTYQTFLGLFADVPYRFVATATPSPNRYKELIHYAGFLGVMDTGQALTRFFQRDSTQANNLTVYPHKELEFRLWLNTWACFVQVPSDLGYSDHGYLLPELEVRYHEVDVDHSTAAVDPDGQAHLFRGGALGVSDAAREKRDTLTARVTEAMRIVDAYVAEDPSDQVILWCDLNAEQDALEKALADRGLAYSSVHGSLDVDEAERRLNAWRNRETLALIGKPVMLGQGMNLQQCNKAIYVGITFKFNDLIQSLHRIQRFGQTRPCVAHLIHADSEREVVRTLNAKWAQHRELTASMSDVIREHGLNTGSITEALTRTVGVKRQEAAGVGWRAVNNDCVDETARMPVDSVDLIVTSIPFSNHYEYTPSYNDFGHTDDNGHFWAQMDFLTPQLLRVLRPGRVYACHVKDRILFGAVTGAGVPTVSPFHAEAIMHGRRHGFDYLGMITVVTDVVRENNQTYRLGWSEQCKDATKMGVGSPEYVLLFHKPQTDRARGYADVPVTKSKLTYTRARWQVDAHAFWRSSGDRHLAPDELAGLPPEALSKAFTDWTLRELYDYEAHIAIGEALDEKGALPATFMSLAPGSNHPDVWHDVNRMITLNGEQSRRAQSMHICLARDSLVLTADGHKPIQDVAIGDLVLTHLGRWRPVLAVENTGVRPVVRLRGQGVNLTLTPDHKVWTRDVSRYARKADCARKVAPGWVEAGHVAGSYVNRKLPVVEPPTVSDLATWWLVGRWLADGHIDVRGCAVISCGAHEVEALTARLGVFGGNPFHDTGTAMQVQLRDPGRGLRSILETCGSGAGGKHLPSVAFTLPVDQARAVLEGYLSGDGHYLTDRGRWLASSVSRELLLGMAFLAQRAFGAAASVYPGRPARSGTIAGRSVNMRADWIFCFDLPGERRKAPLVLDDGAWLKVRSIESAEEVETWNLRVEEDESFTAEGIVVKNCPLQFDIVDRLIVRFTNPGEHVYDPFGGLMTVPFRALKLGRTGTAVELNGDYWRDGVRYCREAERASDAPTLFDAGGAA